MFVAREISAGHKDLIHDVAYDYHGRRMATCSSDQSVKVWDLSDDGEWKCTGNWKVRIRTHVHTSNVIYSQGNDRQRLLVLGHSKPERNLWAYMLKLIA